MHYRRDDIAEARGWLLDCFDDEDTRWYIGNTNAIGIVTAVDHHYEGGWDAFAQVEQDARDEVALRAASGA